MTERQREDDFLDRFLNDDNTQPAPPLTPSDERALLNVAYRAGTPPLIAAPLPAIRVIQEVPAPQPETALVVRTPVPEKTFAQRHPFLLMILGIGIGIILGQRRR